MIYCNLCKEKYHLEGKNEQLLEKAEIESSDKPTDGCEICAFAMQREAYYNGWIFAGDIINKEVAKVEMQEVDEFKKRELIMEEHKAGIHRDCKEFHEEPITVAAI